MHLGMALQQLVQAWASNGRQRLPYPAHVLCADAALLCWAMTKKTARQQVGGSYGVASEPTRCLVDRMHPAGFTGCWDPRPALNWSAPCLPQ
jgi:hypothetical protein